MDSLTTPPLPPDPEVVERGRKLAFARGKYFAWHFATGFVLVVICMPLTSEAIRGLLPGFGARLSKTPLVGLLFSGQSMARVDVAYVAAAVIYVVVIYFWRELLRMWLDPDATTDFSDAPYRTLVTVSAFLILVIDGILMYVAIASLNWGTVTLSFVALLFTLMYLIGLIFASLVSMRLKKDLTKTEEEQ